MLLQFAQLVLELTCRFCNCSLAMYLIQTRCVRVGELPPIHSYLQLPTSIVMIVFLAK